MASNPADVAVVAAWFAAIASIVGALITIITATITARTTSRVASRSVYINSVTVERSKWIDAMRRSIADFSGAAERVISRRRDPNYGHSSEWATDVQSLRTHFSSLKMRLNPREAAAQNLIAAARKLDQAARIHRWADVELATEVMVRHGQWILKFEWHRVKMEAASGPELRRLNQTQIELDHDYAAFLKDDGSLSRLDAIGAGEDSLTITLLRSEMDTKRPAAAPDA
jgi:hypothetical protein